MLSCIWVYDKEVCICIITENKRFFKREELILLSFPIDPDPNRGGEANFLQLNELDSTRISALNKVS